MLPAELHWKNEPLDSQITDDSLSISAGPSDWFINPQDRMVRTNAPAALFQPPDETFRLSAKVSVDFAGTFDAGTLFIYVTDTLWAKLCFEYSPQQQPMVVSVVTRDWSDDCNSVVIEGNSVYLRIAFNGSSWAFHYSLDNQYWHLVRHFSLGQMDSVQIGFSAQAPTGEKCTAVFSEIQYQPGALTALRSGE